MSSKDKYFIFKVNPLKDILWAIGIGFPISFGISFFKVYDSSIGLYASFQKANILLYIVTYIISFFIGFVIKVVCFNGIGSKISKAKINNIGQNFFILIKNLLMDLERPEENEDKLRETDYFLKINNARTGGMLKFSPDNDSVNMLHQVDSMISITEAEPSEWLNPTYNFFLINNYIASLRQSIIKNQPIKSISFSPNREDADFKTFEESKKNILKEISELDDAKSIADFLKEKNIFLRFYTLTQDELDNNKSIIETLIAGHDLFGCYLYFINKNVAENLIEQQYKDRFNTFKTSIDYNSDDNKGRNDLAIALANTNLKTIYRKGNDLVSRTLTTDNSSDLKSYLKELCKLLYRNYDQETHLFNKHFQSENYIMNDEYCYVKIEKP